MNEVCQHGRDWFSGFVLGCTLLALPACGPTAGTMAANAALNTGIAATVSAVRRSRGQCFTPCDNGTRCNPDTGLCERLPCQGYCGYGETCVGTGADARCVYGADESEGTPYSEVISDETRPRSVERWQEEDRDFQQRR